MKDRITIKDDIRELKKKRNAVILVHNYERGEVQDVGDFVGDSLELARQAAKIECEVIVFCGVHFMAETAAILSPNKTVLIPRPDAGCAMAEMIDPQTIRAMKAEHPKAKVVCYVNTTAAVKAECDIACTSANAVKIVESLGKDTEIIFVPDRYLGRYVERKTGRALICAAGYCPIHAQIEKSDIDRARREFKGAEIWAHPECREDVSLAVDYVLSTGEMVKRAHETSASIVVVATEIGMIYRLRRERPSITFVPATEQAICVDMKLATLEHVRDALREMKHVVTVPEEIRRRASLSVERMLAIR